MKLNFKEWNLVYTALTEKAEQIAQNIKWQAEYDAGDGKESDAMKEYKAQQAAILSIIARLENSTL